MWTSKESSEFPSEGSFKRLNLSLGLECLVLGSDANLCLFAKTAKFSHSALSRLGAYRGGTQLWSLQNTIASASLTQCQWDLLLILRAL